MGGTRGGRGKLLFHALTLSPRLLPSGEILMVIKCPLVTMHMPKCD